MVPAITQTLPEVVSLTTTTAVSPPIQTLALPVKSKRIKRKRKRSHKSVSFSSSLDIQIVERNPPQVTWYSADDYDVFESAVRTTIRAMRQNRANHPHYCTRGLEKYRTLAIHEMKKHMETVHVAAILQEQERQRLANVRNTRALKGLSKQHSKWSVAVAIELAKRDAMEAGYKVDTDTNESTCGEGDNVFNEREAESV